MNTGWRDWKITRDQEDPRLFPPQVRVEVKAVACELPHERGIPLSRFSGSEIAREVIGRGIVAQISGSTVWRWLDADAIKPWQFRSWIFPRDSEFEAKASRVLDLYQGMWDGQPLEGNEYVLSADEKSRIQARIRCHPSVPARPGEPMRIEHEYKRGGALNYLAAWDVQHAKLFGRCEEKAGIDAFDRLVEQVMNEQPYRQAKRVFWILDNGSAHRGKRSVDRLQGGWPNLVVVHLPTHASWLNQIEIYFSVVQRKVLTPNDFSDLSEVAERLLSFERRYERTAKPFQWKFTRSDLNRMMRKLSGEAEEEASSA